MMNEQKFSEKLDECEKLGIPRSKWIKRTIERVIVPKRFKKTSAGKKLLASFVGASEVPYTPIELIEDISSKIPLLKTSNVKIAIFYTVEAAIWFIHKLGFTDVTVITETYDDWIADKAEFYGYKYFTSNEVKEKKMKFDLELLNPPYQNVDAQKGCLWANVVSTAYDHLDDNGILCAIIPDSWMGGTLTKISDKKTTKGSLRCKVIDNLDVIHISCGNRINNFFPTVANNFSYFIGIKHQTRSETVLETNLGIEKITLSNSKFIPSNYNHAIKSLLDVTLFCNDYLKVFNGTAKYRIAKNPKKGTSNVQDNEYSFPFVTTSANYTKGLFGYSKSPAPLSNQSKIIWSNSGYNAPFYDNIGKFGLGDHAEAILVDNDHEGNMITWFLTESKLIRALSLLKAGSGKESGFTSISHFIPDKIRLLTEPSDENVNNLFGFSDEIISLIEALLSNEIPRQN